MFRISSGPDGAVYLARDVWQNWGDGRKPQPQHACENADGSIVWCDHPEAGDMEPLGHGEDGLRLVGRLLGVTG